MAIVRKGFAQPQRTISATPAQYRSFQDEVNGFTRANQQYSKTHRGTFAAPGKLVSLGVVREAPRVPNYAAQSRRDTVNGILGSASAIATGIASTAAGASFAPVAVGLGLGYGVYKLGEAIGIY